MSSVHCGIAPPAAVRLLKSEGRHFSEFTVLGFLPSTAGASVVPQHGSASVVPQHGSASVVPQHGSASVVPQHGSASVVPQHGSAHLGLGDFFSRFTALDPPCSV